MNGKKSKQNPNGRVRKPCRLNKNRNQNAWKTLILLGGASEKEVYGYLKNIGECYQLYVGNESDLTFEL